MRNPKIPAEAANAGKTPGRLIAFESVSDTNVPPLP
jgi:hypothetical protein